MLRDTSNCLDSHLRSALQCGCKWDLLPREDTRVATLPVGRSGEKWKPGPCVVVCARH